MMTGQTKKNRLWIQQIREVLLNGVCMDEDQYETGSYEERIMHAEQEFTDHLDHLSLAPDAHEQFSDTVYRYVGQIKEIYTEIGFLSGSHHMNALLQETESLKLLWGREGL